jgi:hypothetical protein
MLSPFSDFWRAPFEAHAKNQNMMAQIEKEREWFV